MIKKNLKQKLTSIGLTIAFSCAYFLPVQALQTTMGTTLKFSTTNNKAGVADTLSLDGAGLQTGDVVKVYATSTSTSATTSAAITSTGQAITFSNTDLLTAAAKTAGSVYVTVTSAGKTESTKKSVSYTSDASTALLSSAVTVKNSAKGYADTIDVTGLATGDVVKVYSTNTTTSAIKSGTATTSALQLSGVDLLGKNAGSVYVSVTKTDKTESTRVAKAYTAEPISAALLATSVKTTNNKTGANDVIDISSLILGNGDVVKVYSTSTGTAVLATGTATTSSIQLTGTNILNAKGGSVYVTVTKPGQNESTRTAVTYSSDVSKSLLSTAVKVVNNAKGNTDTIDVTGLAVGDVVKVYSTSTGTAVLVSGTATTSALQLSGTDLLGAKAGSLYVSITRGSQSESTRTAVAYKAETVATAPLAAKTVVLNVEGTGNDIVRVTGITLGAGSVVKVYSASTGGTLLGSATVATGKTSVSVTNVTLLPITAPSVTGKVYVTITGTNANESNRTLVTYINE